MDTLEIAKFLSYADMLEAKTEGIPLPAYSVDEFLHLMDDYFSNYLPPGLLSSTEQGLWARKCALNFIQEANNQLEDENRALLRSEYFLEEVYTSCLTLKAEIAYANTYFHIWHLLKEYRGCQDGVMEFRQTEKRPQIIASEWMP